MSIFVLTIIIIFIILFSIPTAYANIVMTVYPTKLNLSDAQKAISPYGITMGRIILYSIVIAIVIVTRLKWTKHGRIITNRKIMIESIFYLALGSIVIIESIYNAGVPIFFLFLI